MMEKNKENNGFGPILKPRGSLAKLVSLLVMIISGAIVVWWEISTHTNVTAEFYISSLVLSLLAWLIGQLLSRICLFTEESRHLHSRYEGKWKKAVSAVFHSENIGRVAGIIVIAVLFILYRLYDKQSNIDPLKTRIFLLNAIFLPAFLLLSGLNKPPKVVNSYVNENENKNVSDGLAWSYYFGYLKFVLPALEMQINESDLSKLDDVKEMKVKEIKVKKLFILVPKDCVISENQEILNDQTRIKSRGSLKPFTRSHGGIDKREYKHTVHSVIDEERKEHLCIMEYAAPIKILRNMSEKGLSEEERNIQVSLFVYKLKKILEEDGECKEKYKIITFAERNQGDVADIISRALNDCDVKMS